MCWRWCLDYREFDAVIAHGDSLLFPLTGKPVLRVMHGSALGEARSATSIGRCLLQCGVYGQELLTALVSRGVVAVSENTTRDNPFVAHVIPHGVDDSIFTPWPMDKSPEPSVLFVGALDGRKRGRFLLDGFVKTIRPAHPDASLTIVGGTGPDHPGVTLRDRCQRCGSRRPVPARVGLRIAQHLRGLRSSVSRSDGMWNARRRIRESRQPRRARRGARVGCCRPTRTLPPPWPRCLATRLAAPSCRRQGCGARRSSLLTRMLDGYEKVLFDLTGMYVKSMASV